jgi:hypothetical protein
VTHPADNGPLHGFSVGTILLLTVVVAVGAAGVRTAMTTPASDMPVALAPLRGIAGAMIGALVGICLGATGRRPVIGVVLGFLAGDVVGAFAGVVLAEPKNLPVAAVGSALLVLLGVVVRVFSSRPHGT